MVKFYLANKMRGGEVEPLLLPVSGLFDSSHDAVIIASHDAVILYVNDAAVNMFGYTDRTALINQSISLLMPSEIAANHDEKVIAHSAGEPSAIMDTQQRLTAKKVNGEEFSVEVNVTEYRRLGEVNYLAYIRDMTLVQQKEDDIYRALNFNQVSGLPNQRMLINFLTEYYENENRRNLVLGLCAVRGFQSINETFGFEHTNTLVKEIAKRLLKNFENIAFLGHLNLDVFVVASYVEESSEPELIATGLSSLISTIFEAPISAGNFRTNISFSQSFISLPESADAPHLAVRAAELALSEAQEHPGPFTLFASEQHLKVREKKSWLPLQLREAMETTDFHVVYQPKFDVKLSRFRSAEALIRWKHDGNFISPVDFIPVAEKTGLIRNIGHFVFFETIEALSLLSRSGVDIQTIKIAINLSPIQLGDKGLSDLLYNEVISSGLSTRNFEFEITESALSEHPDIVRSNLKAMRLAGFSVALDDFGTGFSSLHALSQFPIDRVKLDRAFLENVNTDPRRFSLVKNTITLARDLGLEVTIEGVETSEVAQLMKLLGAHELQGYFFSKPVLFDKLGAFLQPNTTIDFMPSNSIETPQNEGLALAGTGSD